MASEHVDYSKLTVPQLKALCKDRKLSGYSKLARPALLEKLGVSQGNTKTSVEVTSQCANGPRPPVIATVRQTQDKEGNSALRLEFPAGPVLPAPLVEPPAQNSPPFNGQMDTPSTLPASSPPLSKRPSTSLVDLPVKKKKYNPPRPPLVLPVSKPVAPVTPSFLAPETSANKENISRSIPNTVHRATSTTTAGKRFKPLTIKKDVNVCAGVSAPANQKNYMASRCSRSDASVSQKVTPRHLEFLPPLPIPALSNILLPPPLLQRKKVQRWSIILSQVPEEDCQRCALVSRTFRYARTFAQTATAALLTAFTSQCICPRSIVFSMTSAANARLRPSTSTLRLLQISGRIYGCGSGRHSNVNNSTCSLSSQNVSISTMVSLPRTSYHRAFGAAQTTNDKSPSL